MAGTLEALLIKTTQQPQLPTVPLAAGSGLVLLPLTDPIVASLMPHEGDDPPVDGFYELTTRIASWARRRSLQHDVAYVHTEFFAGTGFHAAIAWRGGEVACGPMFTENLAGEAEDHYVTVDDSSDMAANVVLRWLGVRRAEHIDEYAVAGLERYRSTEDWAASAPE
jgi:hypothetical protein